jgi:hypothetical protein
LDFGQIPAGVYDGDGDLLNGPPIALPSSNEFAERTAAAWRGFAFPACKKVTSRS